ncbi:MAG: glutamine-hydrolyzing GMP synthase [Acidobacteriota bacterium]|jgi:GMP synthase (glutamine-hydrolysing)
MKHDEIAVIDFGGQYAHLIATKVRRLGVLAEIRQPDDPIEAFAGFKGVIISGSPSLASQGEDSDYNKGIYDLPVPIIGFCFGHQEIARHYGGEIIFGGREWGKADLHVVDDHPLMAGLDDVEQVFMSHNDSVTSVGEGFFELGYSKATKDAEGHRFAAIGSDTYRRYGFQFHPEVDDTIHGDRMIANFVLGICGCKPSWSMDGYLEEEAERLREQVGDNSVFLLASGGVDSTVAAVLIAKTLGPERLHLLHIDNGLMRKNESAEVVDYFHHLGLGDNLAFVDASETFLSALAGATEPEQKRRIIGDTFIEVFNGEAERLGISEYLLGQGTIYPDTIETGATKRADTIKTHHNRVPIIEELIAEGRVVEPLVELYKVEVRELGEKLGIPDKLVHRHPFPGPGLGVRLLCSDGEDDRSSFDTLEPAVAAVVSRFRLDALALPMRSVGVKADLRAYEHPVMLSGPDPEAFWNTLIEATSAITAEVPGINRCVWNLAPQAPTSAHTVAATVTRERLDLLREADALVMDGLERHGLYDDIWQCPTVLVPCALHYADGDEKGEMIIIRPVASQRAMTARPVELPAALLDELRRDILALPGITGLALDVTSKPPGTIEWE